MSNKNYKYIIIFFILLIFIYLIYFSKSNKISPSITKPVLELPRSTIGLAKAGLPRSTLGLAKAGSPTSIVRPTEPRPTLPRPTIPRSTLSIPTIPRPTIPRPTIPRPTIPRPTIPRPTLPRPTIPRPTIPRPIMRLAEPAPIVTTSPYNSKYRLSIVPDYLNKTVTVTILNTQTNIKQGQFNEANGDIIYIGWSSNFNDNKKNINYGPIYTIINNMNQNDQINFKLQVQSTVNNSIKITVIYTSPFTYSQ